MSIVTRLLMGLACLAVVQVHAAGDPQAGRTKAAACAACHGANGKSNNPAWPNLAAQVPGYIAKQLADFKAGRRQNAIMAGQVANLSEQDMADLDAYYASLPLAIAPAQQADEMTALGQKLYRGGNFKTGVSACMSCHGPSGHGIPPHFPRVSGQNAPYTEAQLLAFKSEKRTNDNEIMTRIAFRMSEKEIKAVAKYMQHLVSEEEEKR